MYGVRPVDAQGPPADGARTVVVASRADSLLAVGRLAAAEDALYAAVAARPRAPAPRGALGAYLASRARFRIAEVLLQEAQRFGADPGSVERALSAMAPYRVRVAEGPVVAVAFTPSDDRRALGAFAVRTARRGEEYRAVLDPMVRGVVLGRIVAERATLHGRPGSEVLDELWIAERRLEGLEAAVDPTASPLEIRVGLDALWALHPQVDERAGVLSLGRAPDLAAIQGPVEQVPFVLTFPGLLLVPRVGSPPMAIESRAARALLRGTRWQVDARTATVVVER